jgi:hypothetical protein
MQVSSDETMRALAEIQRHVIVRSFNLETLLFRMEPRMEPPLY